MQLRILEASDRNHLKVENDGVCLNGGFSGSSVIEYSLKRENPTRQPENPGAAGNRQLAILLQYGVGAEDGEGASVVGGTGEIEGEVVGENDILQGSRCRHPLCITNAGGGELQPHRQRIVPYH